MPWQNQLAKARPQTFESAHILIFFIKLLLLVGTPGLYTVFQIRMHLHLKWETSKSGDFNFSLKPAKKPCVYPIQV